MHESRFMKIFGFIVALIINSGSFSEELSEINHKSQFLSGKVVESFSGEALTGVEIEIIGTGERFYSDFDGEFRISGLDPDEEISLRITYISYKKKIIRGINPGKKELIIKLHDDNSPILLSTKNSKLNT